MMPPSRGGSPVLRSPVIMGGLVAVIIAIAAIVGMGVMSGGDHDSGGGSPAKTTATPRQTKVTGKLMGKAKVTVSVRSDPGNDYQILGVLRRGAEVEIVGKSEDGEWLQIIYPPGSGLRGWVLAESMEIEGNPGALDIATPEQMIEPQPTRERAATEARAGAVGGGAVLDGGAPNRYASFRRVAHAGGHAPSVSHRCPSSRPRDRRRDGLRRRRRCDHYESGGRAARRCRLRRGDLRRVG